jgi:hypothetical protein
MPNFVQRKPPENSCLGSDKAGHDLWRKNTMRLQTYWQRVCPLRIKSRHFALQSLRLRFTPEKRAFGRAHARDHNRLSLTTCVGNECATGDGTGKRLDACSGVSFQSWVSGAFSFGARQAASLPAGGLAFQNPQ